MRDVESDRFEVRGESGRTYTVIEMQRIVSFTPVSGPTTHAKGTKSLYLSDGRSVNFIDDNTFQIVQTDEILRKI